MADEVSADDACGDAAHDASGERQGGLHVRLTRVERQIGASQRSLHAVEDQLQPVWRRINRDEPRLAATVPVRRLLVTVALVVARAVNILQGQVTRRLQRMALDGPGLLLDRRLVSNPSLVDS